jgi:type I restriction enzyme S subunit
MVWESSVLGNHIELLGGGTPSKSVEKYWNGSIPWASVKDLKNDHLIRTEDTITEEGVKCSSTRVIPKGQLIIATRMAVGKVVITDIDVAINQDLKAIKCDDTLDEKFLFYLLKSKGPYFDKVSSGATVKGIKIEHIKKLKIFLPPLPIQKKIAAILDAADAYRQKTKALIEKYDELTQSLFLEMFGDLGIHPTGQFLKDHLKIHHGFAFKSTQFNDERVGTPVIKIGTVNKGYFDVESCSFIDSYDNGALEKFKVYPNDLLMSLTGTVGKDDYANLEFASPEYPLYLLNQRVAKIELYESLDPYFTIFLFRQRQIKGEITSLSRGVRQANISNNDIYNLRIKIPDLSLQKDFAERVKSIEAQKSSVRISLEKSEQLFQSLLQKAFKGELIN